MKTKPCQTCTKTAAPRSNYCYACAKARYRAKHPEIATYQNLKSGAKRRGKKFDLTFEQFCEFAQKTEYFLRKGTSCDSLHIDRIEETGGYTTDNIQVLTNSENTRKYRKFVERIEGKATFTTVTSKPIKQGDRPF